MIDGVNERFTETKSNMMEKKINHLARRQVLRNGLIGSMVLVAGIGTFSFISFSAEEHHVDSQMGINVMINGLRSTGNTVCLAAAEKLEASGASMMDYDLHLRNANLGASDVEIIARAIRKISLETGPALRSFSMSYNPGLTDADVVALTRAFPSTLTELGLVECAIGDKGGAALLRWSKQADELRMICVEGNLFSSRIRLGFSALAKERPNLFVVV